jgi:hypothetical protein
MENAVMRNLHVQLFKLKDSSQDSAEPLYMIASSPTGHGGQRTKTYFSKESFVADVKTYLGFSDRAIERFISDPTQHNSLSLPVTDEVATYFGWAH